MTPPKEFLKKIKPFSFLSEAHLDRLVNSMEVVMFPENISIYHQGDFSPAVYMVYSGLVGLYGNTEIVDIVSKGEIFGLWSVVNSTPSLYEAKTLQETICYAFEASTFVKVYEQNPNFASFFKSLAERRFSLFCQMAQDEKPLPEDFGMAEVGTIISRSPVTCNITNTITEAVQLMEREKVGSIVVLDNTKAVGIITNKDLRRALLEGLQNVRISKLMSSPPIYVDKQTPIIEAYTKMLNHGIDHLIIVDNEERVVGVITSKDIFTHLVPFFSILTLYRKIIKATNIETIGNIFRLLKIAIADMSIKGLSFHRLSRMITSVYDTITNQVIRLLSSEVYDQDFVWIHMGSSGRKEQVITTDQDNAIILLSSNTFLELASRINDALEKIDIPKCSANYMASNKNWHLSLEGWKELFRRWFEEPTSDHLRYLTVFLDMRPIYGDPEPLKELLDHIYKSSTNQSIRLLAYDATVLNPPIGIWGIKGLKQGIDLKKYAIYPIVNGIRVLSLDNKILEITNTIERIQALRDIKAIGIQMSEDLKEAFDFMQTLRLRHQSKAIKYGKPADNNISAKELDTLDIIILKESLKITASFQKMLKSRYNIERGL
ncbi:MAG: DUF294 nucleotidyltransferase-like domain-containing protein [Thermodesulforhabdaceae bacterium]